MQYITFNLKKGMKTFSLCFCFDIKDSSSYTNNLLWFCFPRALKAWQGRLYILYVSPYS